MRLRARRRTLVIWSHSADPADWYRSRHRTQVRPSRRFRRGMRLAALLTVMGVMRVVRSRPRRWCSMLVGTVLCVAGVKLGDGWTIFIFAGIWAYVYSVAIPERPGANWADPPPGRTRRRGFSSRKGRTGGPPGRGRPGRSCPAETRA
jgi:hypothetical protein